MNYELAKKLKDAGFPQQWKKGDTARHHVNSDEVAYVPTLEELIAACGVAFSELSKMNHTREPQRWYAVSFPCEECVIEEIKDGFGTTPSEAAANLWLALQTN